MPSNKNAHVLLQPRDRTLLRALGDIRIVDRELAKAIAGFGSTSRCNGRLLQLTTAGLLHRFFLGTVAAGRKAIYTLTPKGAALVNAEYQGIKRNHDQNLVGDLFVEHQLLIAELFVLAMCRGIPLRDAHVRNWRTFRQAPIDTIPLVPDAYFELRMPEQIRPCLIEVDRGTETLKVWQKKSDNYLALAVSGEFARVFHPAPFRVLILTPSLRRLDNIRAHICTENGQGVLVFNIRTDS